MIKIFSRPRERKASEATVISVRPTGGISFVLNWFVGGGVGMGTSDGVQDVRVEHLLKCTGRRRRFGFAF